ncbi:chitobiase/beta-hexosaminidase C-terminal domain-containing protein [Paenibacillus sp. FSL P4-0184]|uniref:chitobiase/beta-hexosaminidase C-terminal domain-containing protein n=1 Tax=Paenibacillus sp. FSL P4-0184 TaxID=2921632 RepID=UPI0030FAD5F1
MSKMNKRMVSVILLFCMIGSLFPAGFWPVTKVHAQSRNLIVNPSTVAETVYEDVIDHPNTVAKAVYTLSDEVKPITLQSSNRLLEDTFTWAVGQALGFVQTGKSGPNNVNNGGGQAGPFTYIPSYWAGYKHRTAFYSRDFVHQSAGAHMIGLDQENFSMFHTFAKGMTEARKWYTLWAFNFDGSNYTIDWKNDNNFVREVPAQFELVEKAYKQYLWTGNDEYINDPYMWDFYTKVMTDFIKAHDSNGNGVAEGTGGGIFSGAVSYNERSDEPIIEAGDAIGSQYQATLAYANMLLAKGLNAEATTFFSKAKELKDYFNKEWSVKDGDTIGNYARALNIDGVTKYNDFGKENSWFMPMKLITDPGQRNSQYLDYISSEIGNGLIYADKNSKAKLDKPNSPANIEAYSYLPDTFYPYNRVDEGWKWLKFLMETRENRHELYNSGTLTNGEYPEISYTIIGNIIEGLMGVEPNAPQHVIVTAPRLSREVPDVKVNALKLGDNEISVAHAGNTKTELQNTSGELPITWEARFYGEYPTINLDGVDQKALHKTVNGVKVSYVTTTVEVGSTVIAEAVASGTVDEKTVAPSSDKQTGIYLTTITVALETATTDAKIYYTLDGTRPTRDSNLYTGPFIIQKTTELKLFAASETILDSDVISYNYTIDALTVEKPTSNVEPGTYSAPFSLELSTTTADSDIYYTTDGKTPTKSSLKYNGPIKILETTTIKTIAYKKDWVDSPVETFNYAIVLPKTTIPTASKASGRYDKGIQVSLESGTEGASIYYTTNGDMPTKESTLYTGAIDLSRSTSLKAIAVKDGYTNSEIVSFVYIIMDSLPETATKSVYISDLDWVSATSGWAGHPPLKDRAINNNKTPIKINGETFEKGIGTHATSTIVYNIGGAYGTFKAVIGIDDVKNTKGSPSTMWFEVLGDGLSLYKSPTFDTINGPAPGIPIEVDVTGIYELTLFVNDAGTPVNNPTNSDHADWADAQLIPRKAEVSPTAAEIAATLTTIAAPAKDATKLTLPVVPAGYTIAIKTSSSTNVIALDGTIVPPSEETVVDLVLEVTRASDDTKASTTSIVVIVPAKTTSTPEDPGPSNPKPETTRPDTLVVRSEDLAKLAANGKVTISATDDQKYIVIPANTAQLLGQNQLTIQTNRLTLDLSSEWVQQLVNSISNDNLKDSSIKFTINPLPEAEADKLLVNGDYSQRVKLLGEVFNISLSIMKDGEETRVTTFNKPITIRLKEDPYQNSKLVGIYYISDSGVLDYIGGEYMDGEWVAQINHLSKYAVLEVTKTFTDVPASHWAANVIQELASKQILSGTNEKVFEPERKVTRAEFTTMLVRAFKHKQTSELKISFADVMLNDWYTESISIAVQAGIVTGKSDTIFAPNAQITREEMVTMLMRAYEIINGKTAINPDFSFKDDSKVSPWAEQYVKGAGSLLLITGRSDGIFEPKGISTRAEAAQAIYNLVNK